MPRTAAGSEHPGGRLVVGRGSTAPWSWSRDPDVGCPSPPEAAEEPAPDASERSLERAGTPQRPATGPEGSNATVVGHVLVLRRAGTLLELPHGAGGDVGRRHPPVAGGEPEGVLPGRAPGGGQCRTAGSSSQESSALS
ncbi:hypothetical protein [Streptomyces sp. 135]|uniref:hypothetical protein n=1 Tax=Streptomyces sp. 135 TaxID=2838850 RepID=UPI0021D84C57|nr:hypothetical protein [Streptomyces sp. 135]